MSELDLGLLGKATWETFYMVFLSSAFSIFLGLILGVVLFMTTKGRPFENRYVNHSLGFIVNATRSIPFIILLISVIPITRLIVGTSIGTNAAIVPLTLAAIPFFARVAEAAFLEASGELLETAASLGANRWQIIYKFILPESLSALIKGGTLTIIGLIGYSAMAGVVGGGGLGELAINYGYQRFDITVMLLTVIILIVMVQLIQHAGDYLVKYCKFKWAGIVVLALFLLLIGGNIFNTYSKQKDVIIVGVMSGLSEKIMQVGKQVARKKHNLHIKIVTFHDYVQPNVALSDGSIDANVIQHLPYLKSQIKAHNYQLTPIAKTFVYPFGFYSRKIQSISQLKRGDLVVIPNDPSNGGRALLILAKHGVIKLRKGVGLFPKPRDIISNPRHLIFKELAAAQIPRALDDAVLGGLSNDYTDQAGFNVSQAILKEESDSPYANLLVVKTGREDDPIFKKFIEVIHSKPFIKATQEAYPNGAAIPAF